MEQDSNIKVSVGSERNFGIVFGAVFLALTLVSMFSGNQLLASLLFALSIGFILIAFFRDRWLKIPNLLWFKFGIFLGGIVAPVVMAIIFISVFLPIGILMRLLGHDPLSRSIEPSSSSYWIKRKALMQSMKRQF